MVDKDGGKGDSEGEEEEAKGERGEMGKCKKRKRKERLSRKNPFPLLHMHTERARGGHKEHGKVTNVWL